MMASLISENTKQAQIQMILIVIDPGANSGLSVWVSAALTHTRDVKNKPHDIQARRTALKEIVTNLRSKHPQHLIKLLCEKPFLGNSDAGRWLY